MPCLCDVQMCFLSFKVKLNSRRNSLHWRGIERNGERSLTSSSLHRRVGSAHVNVLLPECLAQPIQSYGREKLEGNPTRRRGRLRGGRDGSVRSLRSWGGRGMTHWGQPTASCYITPPPPPSPNFVYPF